IRAVHPVAGDLDRALRTGDDRRADHVWYPGSGGLLQDTLRTAAHRQAHNEAVLGVTATRSHSGERGAHLCDLAEPRPHLVDEVRAGRTEPTASPAAVEPPFRHG